MSPTTLTLYHYWRSSSSWRVRLALAHKGLRLGTDVELRPINLLNGENESPAHIARHPLGYVPVLEIKKAGELPRYLIESVAIMEWLDETMPPPQALLYPRDSWMRAQVRSLVELINADTQPLGNPNVVEMAASDEDSKLHWSQYFIRRGLGAYQNLLSSMQVTAAKAAGKARFSLGDQPWACDFVLVPQCYNAIRNQIDLSNEFPRLASIYQAVNETSAGRSAHPDQFKPSS